MPISFIPYTAVYGPLSIPGVTCALWLDAADPTTLTYSGSTVTQWRDKSASRNNSTSCSATTSIINGNTVLTNPVISGPITNSGSSVVNFFIVGTLASTGGLYYSMLALNAATVTNYYAAGTLFACYYGGTNPPQFYSYMNGNLSLSSTGVVNTPYIFNAFQSGTTGTTFFNGNSSGAVGTAGNTFTYTNYYIGAIGGAPGWLGNIAEIIVFNTILSTPQRQSIEGYLAQKWGTTSSLPPGHPGLSQTFYNGKVYQPQISLKPAPYANYFPLSVAGCAFWLDAADITTMTFNGSAIIQWNDKSPSSNYVSQATVANAPTLGTSQNGLNTVYFATTNQQLVSSQNSPTPGNASRTVIALFWCPTLSSQYMSVTGTESGANPAPAWGMAKNANADVDYPFMYSTAGYDQYTFVYSTPNPLLTYAQYDSGASFFSGYYATAGATGGTTTVGNFATRSMTFNTTAGVWYIGRRQQAAIGSVTSHLLEMIHYTRALTTTERQQVEGYLAWKWGLTNLLPSTHPYYSSAPLQYTRGAILGAPTLTATGSASYANTAYYNVSPQAWNYNWRPYLQSLVAANSQANATASTIPVASQGHWGGVLASNACIYCAPTQNTNVLVINTLTNTTINLAVGVSGYQGGVLAPDGKIYFIPAGSPTSVLVVNPTDNSFTTFTGTASYTGGWVGGTLASNGLIYCSPLNAVNVLVIDPINRTTSNLVGAATYPASGNYSWQCAVLAPNGLIYMPPTGATTTLVVDPLMNTTSNMAFTAGSAYQANGWIGGVLHPNGKIYCTPYSATSVLIIDPIAGTTNTTALALAASASPGVAAYTTPAGWSGATLGPNGKIYCSPHLATSFLVIDPTAGTTSNLAVTNNTSPGAILAPNGNIYAIPRGSASTTLMLTFSTLAQSPNSNYCLSAWTNRF